MIQLKLGLMMLNSSLDSGDIAPQSSLDTMAAMVYNSEWGQLNPGPFSYIFPHDVPVIPYERGTITITTLGGDMIL